MHLIAFTADTAGDAVIQLGIAGLAIWMLFKLLTPVVSAMVRAMDAVVETQRDISRAIVGVTQLVAEMRHDLATHITDDAQTGQTIIGHLQRLKQLGRNGTDG